MNQEQVTTENTEEKAAEVTTQSETTQQPEKAIRPKGKWFGRGIYGSKDVPIRILDGLIGVLIVVIVGMIIFFAVRGGFNIVYDTDGGSEVAARKVRYGEFLTEPETPYKPGYTFDGWYTEKEGRDSAVVFPVGESHRRYDSDRSLGSRTVHREIRL
ncbi:MAG: InlB B-repeat-containing protein [Waltera sp.]